MLLLYKEVLIMCLLKAAKMVELCKNSDLIIMK